MKRPIAMLLLCIGLFVATAEALPTFTQAGSQIMMNEKKKISLKGDFTPIGIQTEQPDAITAFLAEDEVTAYFNADLGHVTVTITDQSDDVVHSSVVHSSIGQATVSLIGLPMGTYTITFSNSSGEMWGDFVL